MLWGDEEWTGREVQTLSEKQLSENRNEKFQSSSPFLFFRIVQKSHFLHISKSIFKLEMFTFEIRSVSFISVKYMR